MGLTLEKQRKLAHVAQRYYLEDWKQSDIAEELGVSSPLISRMLREARELGVVEIVIHEPGAKSAILLERLRRTNAIQGGVLVEDGEDGESLFFVSCVPWLSYTSMIQPVPVPADSNPRITWGKYFRQGEQTLMPVTLLAHHALVDGIHIARFYEALDREMAAIT